LVHKAVRARAESFNGETSVLSTKFLGWVALVAGLAAGPAAASAIYTIGIPNAALSPYPGPYATVQVNLINPTQAHVTFTALSDANYWYLMGDGGSADLNVNGAYLLGPVTGTAMPGFSAPSFVSNTPGNVSSFGVFNLSLNFFDGFTHAATSIEFDLQKTSGTWASDLDVLAANPLGYFAAVHTFVCAINCSPTGAALVTGFAATNTLPRERVPEPNMLALVALAILALAMVRRRATG
jgi:hypothetical protein